MFFSIIPRRSLVLDIITKRQSMSKPFNLFEYSVLSLLIPLLFCLAKMMSLLSSNIIFMIVPKFKVDMKLKTKKEKFFKQQNAIQLKIIHISNSRLPCSPTILNLIAKTL